MRNPSSPPPEQELPAQSGNEAEVRQTLERLIRVSGDGYAALSRLIGRNPAYIQQYVKRGVPKRLSEEDRRRLAQHFGISETLLGAPPPAQSRISPDSARHNCVEIPRIRVTRNDPGSVLLDRSLLHGLANVRDNWLTAHQIEGDAMAPTLREGDLVLVDTADCRMLRDGIYVLEIDSNLVVKRLSINPATRMVTILSDNASYPSFTDCDPALLRAVGRVVWLGRAV